MTGCLCQSRVLIDPHGNDWTMRTLHFKFFDEELSISDEERLNKTIKIHLSSKSHFFKFFVDVGSLIHNKWISFKKDSLSQSTVIRDWLFKVYGFCISLLCRYCLLQTEIAKKWGLKNIYKWRISFWISRKFSLE